MQNWNELRTMQAKWAKNENPFEIACKAKPVEIVARFSMKTIKFKCQMHGIDNIFNVFERYYE